MDLDSRFWLRLWQSGFAAVVLLAVVIAIGCNYRTRLFVDAGYTQVSLPGTSGANWVKP